MSPNLTGIKKSNGPWQCVFVKSMQRSPLMCVGKYNSIDKIPCVALFKNFENQEESFNEVFFALHLLHFLHSFLRLCIIFFKSRWTNQTNFQKWLIKKKKKSASHLEKFALTNGVLAPSPVWQKTWANTSVVAIYIRSGCYS